MTTQRALQGIGTRDDIDKTFKLGMNHPMGPLQLGKH
jgi:3-hydroxybutyryl-CoA dehydrogenase